LVLAEAHETSMGDHLLNSKGYVGIRDRRL